MSVTHPHRHCPRAQPSVLSCCPVREGAGGHRDLRRGQLCGAPTGRVTAVAEGSRGQRCRVHQPGRCSPGCGRRGPPGVTDPEQLALRASAGSGPRNHSFRRSVQASRSPRPSPKGSRARPRLPVPPGRAGESPAGPSQPGPARAPSGQPPPQHGGPLTTRAAPDPPGLAAHAPEKPEPLGGPWARRPLLPRLLPRPLCSGTWRPWLRGLRQAPPHPQVSPRGPALLRGRAPSPPSSPDSPTVPGEHVCQLGLSHSSHWTPVPGDPVLRLALQFTLAG